MAMCCVSMSNEGKEGDIHLECEVLTAARISFGSGGGAAKPYISVKTCTSMCVLQNTHLWGGWQCPAFGGTPQSS